MIRSVLSVFAVLILLVGVFQFNAAVASATESPEDFQVDPSGISAISISETKSQVCPVVLDIEEHSRDVVEDTYESLNESDNSIDRKLGKNGLDWTNDWEESIESRRESGDCL